MHAKWDAEAEARIKARERLAILEELEQLAKEYHGRTLEDGHVERGAESILADAGRRLVELEQP